MTIGFYRLEYLRTQVKNVSIMTLNDISLELGAEIDTWQI